MKHLALIILLIQAVPAGTSVIAALGHSAFHLSERLALVQADHMAQARDGWMAFTLSYEHTHGPGEEAHQHAVPVDLALQLAAASDDPDERPVLATDQRVDQHIPPAHFEKGWSFSERHPPGIAPSMARSVPPSPPSPPPPRA
jgi:hypothetical protein